MHELGGHAVSHQKPDAPRHGHGLGDQGGLTQPLGFGQRCIGVALGGPDVPRQQGGQAAVQRDGRHEPGIAPRLAQGLLEQPGRRRPAVLVVADPSQPLEGGRAGRPRRKARHELLQEDPGPPGRSGVQVVFGGLEGPAGAILVRAGRGEAAGRFAQLGRGRGGAPASDRPRRLLQLLGHGGVRLL